MDSVGEPRILLGEDAGGERPDDQREDDQPAPVDPNAHPRDPAEFEVAVHATSPWKAASPSDGREPRSPPRGERRRPRDRRRDRIYPFTPAEEPWLFEAD